LPAPLANEGNNAMTDSNIQQIEEEMLSLEISDEALEAAAGSVKDKAASMTISFCSGLDTCGA
jgi:hypothetical protein